MLSCVGVIVFGFILLNLAFIFDFLFQSLIRLILGLFIPVNDINMNISWFPPLMHISFLVLIGLISWFVFKSKLKTIYKAIYMTVPLAVIFVTIGMFLYRWQVAVYSLSLLFGICVLYYLYKTKKPWIYYYTLILISIVMLLVFILGIEI